MITLIYFETNEELEQITGLNYQQLLDRGFPVDKKWNFGVFTKEKIFMDFDLCYDERYDIDIPFDEYGYTLSHILHHYNNHMDYIEFNGTHYYISRDNYKEK